MTQQRSFKRLVRTRMEKTGESLTYLQGQTNTTRMDYASPIFNELAFRVGNPSTTDVIMGTILIVLLFSKNAYTASFTS